MKNDIQHFSEAGVSHRRPWGGSKEPCKYGAHICPFKSRGNAWQYKGRVRALVLSSEIRWSLRPFLFAPSRHSYESFVSSWVPKYLEIGKLVFTLFKWIFDGLKLKWKILGLRYCQILKPSGSEHFNWYPLRNRKQLCLTYLKIPAQLLYYLYEETTINLPYR